MKTSSYVRVHVIIIPWKFCFLNVKDTHGGKAPSIKTPALAESMNMDIWIVGNSNQLCKTGSYNETKFSKKWSSYQQNCALCDRSILYLTLVSEMTVNIIRFQS